MKLLSYGPGVAGCTGQGPESISHQAKPFWVYFFQHSALRQRCTRNQGSTFFTVCLLASWARVSHDYGYGRRVVSSHLQENLFSALCMVIASEMAISKWLAHPSHRDTVCLGNDRADVMTLWLTLPPRSWSPPPLHMIAQYLSSVSLSDLVLIRKQIHNFGMLWYSFIDINLTRLHHWFCLMFTFSKSPTCYAFYLWWLWC